MCCQNGGHIIHKITKIQRIMSKQGRINKMTGCDAYSDSSEEAYPAPKQSKAVVEEPIRTRSANSTKVDSPEKKKPIQKIQTTITTQHH